jgi:hypothetical protein
MDFHQQDIRRFLLESIPSRFSHITNWDFESLVRYLLEVDGYVLKPAVPTGDLANKILASKDDALLVVQPLRLDPEILVEEVEIRKAIHSRSFYNADQFWIITTSYFSPEARQFAEETEIEMWDWDALYEALCQSFFEGKSHEEFLQEHPLPMASEEIESELKLKVKWQATEGIGPEWFNLGITISNPTDRNLYIHLELPALIDHKRNQVMADQWIDGDFVAGMIYAGATIKTNALYSVVKLGDRPPGGRVVLTCHERVQVPRTHHLHAKLQGQACFIVTYCYTTDSPEYRTMVAYRDEILSKTFAGRAFIQGYYFISPHLIRWASQNSFIDAFVRKITDYILPAFINRMHRKQILNQ